MTVAAPAGLHSRRRDEFDHEEFQGATDDVGRDLRHFAYVFVRLHDAFYSCDGEGGFELDAEGRVGGGLGGGCGGLLLEGGGGGSAVR